MASLDAREHDGTRCSASAIDARSGEARRERGSMAKPRERGRACAATPTADAVEQPPRSLPSMPTSAPSHGAPLRRIASKFAVVGIDLFLRRSRHAGVWPKVCPQHQARRR
ncbi:hypothetical protein U91I_03452 [alpha proteobacterium U9-1i]|nr:hypothetical protein U91I_03452 [alpha proteobacterium U9-1i]